MRKFIYLFAAAIIAISMTGCGSSKKVTYLQGAGEDMVENLQFTPLYDARILPKDLLTITVSATNPEAVASFNLTVPSGDGQSSLQSYLVDNNGQINFPVIGMITLKGLTKREAELKITDLLGKYVREKPVVNVSTVNYKISVIGEVRSPNTFVINNEKVSIFEALAMAGDMTIYGRRDNVKILREDAEGNKQVFLVDLNDRNIIYSPNFYLQQNDVIIVEPNKARVESGEMSPRTSLWFSGTSVLVSVATLVITLIRIYK